MSAKHDYSVRICLCPTLPDRVEALELQQASEWGKTSLIGQSHIMELYQGSSLKLELQGQSTILTWQGMSCATQLLYKPREDKRQAGETMYKDTLVVNVVKGEGKRASRVTLVQKKAKIPASGLEIELGMTVESFVPPGPPVELTLHSRTQWDFTITWKKPTATGGSDVTLYALELSTVGSMGTYRAFEEFWQGPGELLVDVNLDSDAAVEADPNLCSHRFEMPAGMFGRLRMRCWSKCEQRPSVYSTEVKLPRYLGKQEDEKTTEQSEKEERESRRGSASGRKSSVSGRESRVSAREKAKTKPKDNQQKSRRGSEEQVVLVEFKSCMPELDLGMDGVVEARQALRLFFQEAGSFGGRDGQSEGATADKDGQLYGLWTTHVVLAICGNRTKATLRQPLLALMEVVLFDALEPQIELVGVLQGEWGAIIERVEGTVLQVASLIGSNYKAYIKSVPYIKGMLLVLVDLWETMRMCQSEMAVYYHLTDSEYPKNRKKQLQAEIIDRMLDLCWRISTDLLKMQLRLYKCGSMVPSMAIEKQPGDHTPIHVLGTGDLRSSRSSDLLTPTVGDTHDSGDGDDDDEGDEQADLMRSLSVQGVNTNIAFLQVVLHAQEQAGKRSSIAEPSGRETAGEGVNIAPERSSSWLKGWFRSWGKKKAA